MDFLLNNILSSHIIVLEDRSMSANSWERLVDLPYIQRQPKYKS